MFIIIIFIIMFIIIIFIVTFVINYLPATQCQRLVEVKVHQAGR